MSADYFELIKLRGVKCLVTSIRSTITIDNLIDEGIYLPFSEHTMQTWKSP